MKSIAAGPFRLTSRVGGNMGLDRSLSSHFRLFHFLSLWLQFELLGLHLTILFSGINFAIPLTPDRPRIPIFWKRGLRRPKAPFSLRPHTGWKREFSVKNSPFPLCSLAEKWGFFDRKLPFPGFLDPETLFSRNGDSGPVSGVRGINSRIFLV